MPLRTFVLFLGAALAGGAGSAHAVCTAAQIISQEPSCPAAGSTCLISKQYQIENGCTLDFGARDVTIQSNAVLTIESRAFTLRARRLTILGRIDGVGSGIGATGGMVTIQTTSDLTVTPSGSIDVKGNRSGGAIIADIDGSVLIAGKLLARDNNAGEAAGGLISITAAGDITDGIGAVIDAQGGIDSPGGGEIDLVAGGDLTLVSPLNVRGYDGGFIVLEAGGKATVGSANASGRGDAGAGGCVDLFAGAGAEIKGEIDASGASGSFSGGCGGLICIDGGLGDTRIPVGAVVNANGAMPDGGGGQVALTARGSVLVSGTITARGPTGETCGGDLCIDAGYDMQLASGELDVSGGDAGGDLEIIAGRSMSVNAPVAASGRRSGSLGGDISLRAGLKGSGSLSVAGTIDASSDGACSQFGCGQGGVIDLAGCNVTFSGTLLASGPNAGENLVTARDLLSSFGTMDATRTVASGAIGLNRLVHRADRAPTLNLASIDPAPSVVAVATCTTTGQTDPPCLAPCPVCGNNLVEFPETCDRGVVPPESCSGCSAFCRVENCDDGRFCTADSCDVTFGCVNQPTPGCHEPTATVTGTLPTATGTPTPSLTPTRSPIPSATGSIIATVSPAVTPSTTVTSTASSTVVTATPSASRTASPTRIETATPTVSNTKTETPTSGPTVTAPPACPGDCNGVGGVTVNELVLGVNIALGSTGAGVCPAFDSDNSGTVSISELIAAVNAALNGC